MNQPYAFATKSGDIVLRHALDQYAIKDSNPSRGSNKDPFNIQVAKSKTGTEESKQAPEIGYTNYGYYGLITPPYNPKILAGYTELNTYHARSTKTAAIDIGGQGWDIVANVKKPNENGKQEIVDFFNHCMPIFEDILTNAAQDYEEVGWGCLELIRTGNVETGKPLRFEHVPSHTIRIHKFKKKFMQSWDGINRRWFKRIGYQMDVHVKTGEEYPLGSLKPDERANELIYNYQYSSRGTYYGVPVYVPVVRTMIGDRSAVEYNVVFFKNFGLPTYALFITGDFKDEPEKDSEGNPTGKTVLQSKIEAQLKNVVDNPGSGMVIMLPNDNDQIKVEVRFEKLSVDIKDSSFRLYREANRDEIVTANGMDPYRVGILPRGALGGNTSIESKKNYKSTKTTPSIRTWEAYINNFVIWHENGFKNTDWKIKLREIDIGDKTERVDRAVKLFNVGAMSPNDFVDNFGNEFNLKRKEHPAMDAHYINNVPIDYVPDVPSNTPNDVVKVLEDFKRGLLEVKKSYDKGSTTH